MKYYVLYYHAKDRYWNKDAPGWTSKDNATVYSQAEKDRSLLQGKWIEVEAPAAEPATTPRPPSAADDPDHFNPAKGGNRAGDDYW